MKNFIWYKKIVFVSLSASTIFFVMTVSVHSIFAQVMTSSSYEIQSDSVNFGGILSNSSNYVIEDTLGEIATGESSSSNYKIKAGYQQMQEIYLAISAASDVSMSPSLNGTTGGTSDGSTATTVTTDNLSGYELSIKSSYSPAMQGNSAGGTIADYTPAGSAPDFTFSVAAADGEFGFTPEGTDITSEYKDNGSACNVGSGATSDACWNPITVTDETIASRTTSNHPSGTATTIKFRLTLGSSHFQIEDTYTATTVLTAVAL